MSKQRNQEPETENSVAENLINQSELVGLDSGTKPLVNTSEKVVSEKIDTSPKLKINKVATAAVSSNKKMGVYKFLSLYPQDIYIETLLKFYYPHSFFTKDVWFQKIDDVLKTPYYN